MTCCNEPDQGHPDDFHTEECSVSGCATNSANAKCRTCYGSTHKRMGVFRNEWEIDRKELSISDFDKILTIPASAGS